MSVYVPHVKGMLHERTEEWCHRTARTLHATPWRLDSFPRLDCTPDTAYWRLLANVWQDGFNNDDLVIVEQDMVPSDGVVERMLACRRPWCVSPYTIGSPKLLLEGLGCVKFAARLKTRHPDLMEQVGKIADDGMPAKDWHRLDTRIARVMRDLGYRPHCHARSEHLHDYMRRP